MSFATHSRILFSSEYFHYKIFIHKKILEDLNDNFQENLSRPGIINARARYRAAARRFRNTALDSLIVCDIVGEPAAFCLRCGKVGSSEMLVVMYQCTRCHISKSRRLYIRCRENHRSLAAIVLLLCFVVTEKKYSKYCFMGC